MAGKREKPLALDMEFDEAMKRFVQTDLDELPDRIKLKKRKPAKGKRPSAGKVGNKGNPRSNRQR